ncbi:MAG TPA: methyltransferase domain-containing protein, partial [Myxococcota bacterium]
AEQLIVVDISLRSVLLARARARATATSKPRRDAIVGVVAAADVALPVLDDSVDVIVAENVVDVVDDPSGLLSAFALALKPGGTLLLTSPDPDLGTMPSDPDDDETDGDEEEPALFALLEACGFDVVDDVDGLRWPRVHGPRHVEVWTCVGLRCVKR